MKLDPQNNEAKLIQGMKDRETRKQLMEEYLDFKRQIIAVFNFMQQDKQEYFNNALLAQLSDVAYKAIRKASLQKRLD